MNVRTAVLVFAALLAVSIVACGGDTEVAPDTQPSDNAGDLDQDQFRLLPEGEFIDTNPIRGDSGAFVVISRVDTVVVAEILEVVAVTVRTRPAPPNWPVDEIEDRPVTAYSARVDQWVKGEGEGEILITQFGGVTASGPRFTDGDFLLQPGRRYVVALTDRDKLEIVPGPGQYVKTGLGLGAFEVTDGFVHVLNNPIAQDLQEQFGGMPLADFVQVLEGYVANPPPSPTPPPAPTPAHDVTVPGSPFLIDTVAIDTDIDAGRANTTTSLGGRQACNTLNSGGTLTIDVTVDAVPPLGEERGGIAIVEFKLIYDPSKVKVAASDQEMLLAANPGSSLFTLGDATPDADGSFLVAAVDFSNSNSTPPESGAGVLARITLEGVGSGVSDLELTDVIIADVFGAYSIDNVLAARVAVDAACPTTS